MAKKKVSKYKNRFRRSMVWFLSTVMAFSFSFTAAASSKKNYRSMRTQVRIARIQAEISDKDFKPTMEMIKVAPDVVKAEMKIYEEYSAKLKKLQARVKGAQYQEKLFQRLHKQKAASIGEVRKKTHQFKSLKSQVLAIRAKALTELEHEMLIDAQMNDAEKMPLKIQMARIAAEVNDKPFKPTKTMIKAAPDFVKAQQALYNAHAEQVDVIDARINIADDEMKLAKDAFNKGFISKTEFLQIKHDHNKLVNDNLKLHCQILTRSEEIKIGAAGENKSEWAKKLKMARISAHMNNNKFTPTPKMKEMVPNLVALEKQLYNCNKERFSLLKEREVMLVDKYKMTNKAYKSGVASTKELNKAKQQLVNFQDYRTKLKDHFQRELNLVMANLDMDLGG